MFRVLVLCVVAACPAAAQQESGPSGTWFSIPQLNAGLPAAPESIDRSTPQSAVESFLDAVERGNFENAAHLLNLSGIDAADQARRGPRLAEQLHSILERRAVLSWRTLLERPDALNARQNSSAAMAGEPRRSILLGVLDEGGREAAIRLNRVRADGDDDPAWVFASRTVDQIPALYERYGPTDLEQALPDWLREDTIIGLRLFETIGLPIILVVAWIAGTMTYRLFQWLSRKTTGYWARVSFSALRWPSIIVVTTSVVLYASLEVFTVSGTIASILTPMVLVGYVAAVMFFALSVLDTALDRIVTFDTEKLADPDNSTVRNYATLMTAARRALIVIGLVIGIGIVLSSANMFRSLGFSLLASAGAVTLIVGFAARHVLGNILASLQIAMNRSARIGDRIIYEGYYTTVERIHFTYVQLKNWDGNRIVVPVSHFQSDSFENWSMVDGGMVCHAKITLHQQAPLDEIRARFLDACEEHAQITVDDDCKMIIVSQDAFGVVARFQFRVDDPSETWDTECEMRERIVRDAQKIEHDTGQKVLPEGGMDDMAQ